MTENVVNDTNVEESDVLQHIIQQADNERQLSEEERIEQLKKEIEKFNLDVEQQENKIRVEFEGVSPSSGQKSNLRDLPSAGAMGNVSSEDKDFQQIVNERMNFFLQQNPDETWVDAPLTTEQFYLRLEELEERQKEFEEQGLYLEAQQIMNQIKELNLVEGKKLEQQYHKNKRRAHQELQQKHVIEQQAFEEIWSGKLEEYDRQAKEIIIATLDRQKWEKQETEQHLRSQYLVQKPKFSKELLNSKVQMEKLVKQKMYTDAEDIRKNLRPRELQEIRAFEQGQEAKVQLKMKVVAQKHTQEIEALKQRIQKGKSELSAQKRLDKSRLDQQHQNAWLEFETKQKRLMARAKEYINKQSTVLLTSTRKHAVDYTHLQGFTRERTSSTSSPSHSRPSSALSNTSAKSLTRKSSSERMLDGNKKRGSTSRLTKKINLLK
jgi:hypothetical protein